MKCPVPGCTGSLLVAASYSRQSGRQRRIRSCDTCEFQAPTEELFVLGGEPLGREVRMAGVIADTLAYPNEPVLDCANRWGVSVFLARRWRRAMKMATKAKRAGRASDVDAALLEEAMARASTK